MATIGHNADAIGIVGRGGQDAKLMHSAFSTDGSDIGSSTSKGQ